MGKSIREIGYTIYQIITNNYITDDHAIVVEMIYDMCHDVRSSLIARDFKKHLRLDSAYFTMCNCVEIKCKEITCLDTNGDTIESGIIEKYIDVPFLNNAIGKDAIKYLGGPDLQTPLRVLNVPFGIGGPQTKNAPGYMHIGNRLILKNVDDDMLGVLTLIGLTKNGSCSNDCDLDSPYNIPEDLVHELEGIVLKRLSISLNIKKDLKNDAVN